MACDPDLQGSLVCDSRQVRRRLRFLADHAELADLSAQRPAFPNPPERPGELLPEPDADHLEHRGRLHVGRLREPKVHVQNEAKEIVSKFCDDRHERLPGYDHAGAAFLFERGGRLPADVHVLFR